MKLCMNFLNALYTSTYQGRFHEFFFSSYVLFFWINCMISFLKPAKGVFQITKIKFMLFKSYPLSTFFSISNTGKLFWRWVTKLFSIPQKSYYHKYFVPVVVPVKATQEVYKNFFSFIFSIKTFETGNTLHIHFWIFVSFKHLKQLCANWTKEKCNLFMTLQRVQWSSI